MYSVVGIIPGLLTNPNKFLKIVKWWNKSWFLKFSQRKEKLASMIIFNLKNTHEEHPSLKFLRLLWQFQEDEYEFILFKMLENNFKIIISAFPVMML